PDPAVDTDNRPRREIEACQRLAIANVQPLVVHTGNLPEHDIGRRRTLLQALDGLLSSSVIGGGAARPPLIRSCPCGARPRRTACIGRTRTTRARLLGGARLLSRPRPRI